MNTDTPLPPEEPVGQNPPDGAVIDYWLKENIKGEVKLVLKSSASQTLIFSSSEVPAPLNANELNKPTHWVRPTQTISTRAGMHRFVWDLHLPAPPALEHDYPISAVTRETWLEPRGAWVPPGDYTATLLVNGQEMAAKAFAVRMDPRVTTPLVDLAQQFNSSQACMEGMTRTFEAIEVLRVMKPIDPNFKTLLRDCTELHGDMARLLEVFQSADVKPTEQAIAAESQAQQRLTVLMSKLDELKKAAH